jgi:hypothetical protein
MEEHNANSRSLYIQWYLIVQNRVLTINSRFCFLQRKYIREITVERARKLKGFWSSFYTWKTNNWPNGISQEDWNVLHHEDKINYQEK